MLLLLSTCVKDIHSTSSFLQPIHSLLRLCSDVSTEIKLLLAKSKNTGLLINPATTLRYLFQVVGSRLQQLLATASPSLAVADVRTEPDHMQPECNAVRIPARERQIQITVKESTST